MKLFSFNDPQVEARQQRDQQRLAVGDLPLGAEVRLKDMRSRPGFFTSNLSVNEFLLTRQGGCRPLGQVTGTSVFHVGWQWTPMYDSQEMVTLNHAYYTARILALSRLQQEAALLGAHGVTGVRVTRSVDRWGENLMEFTVRGTAIAIDGEDPPRTPFVSDLSGQEYWALREAGYKPVGFVFGTSRWYQIGTFMTRWAMGDSGLGRGSMYNMELTDYTYAFYNTRQLAMSRMHIEAQQVGAEGIIGVAITKSIETREVEPQEHQKRTDLIVQFTAVGTAVTRVEDRNPPIDYTMLLDR